MATKTKRSTRKARTKIRSIGIIGAGNMATALVRGFVRSGLFDRSQVWVSDADAGQRRKAKQTLRVATTADNGELVRGSRVVVLAVKPQIIDSVLDAIRPQITKRHVVISIAAGVSTKRLEKHLGRDTRVVRVMPNTPALLARGMSVIVRGRKATSGDERLALRLFRAIGAALAVRDERLLDPVTGLSGSGPAYVYLFAEALIAGGEAAGLPPAVAHKLALETVLGAAHMLAEAGESPRRLREMVTSPGGTTLAGLTEMQRRGFADTVVAGVRAATERSVELGGS